MPFNIPPKLKGVGAKINSGVTNAAVKSYKLSYFTGRYALRVARAARMAYSAVFNVALSELVAKTGDVARYVYDFQRSSAGRGEI